MDASSTSETVLHSQSVFVLAPNTAYEGQEHTHPPHKAQAGLSNMPTASTESRVSNGIGSQP